MGRHGSGAAADTGRSSTRTGAVIRFRNPLPASSTSPRIPEPIRYSASTGSPFSCQRSTRGWTNGSEHPSKVSRLSGRSAPGRSRIPHETTESDGNRVPWSERSSVTLGSDSRIAPVFFAMSETERLGLESGFWLAPSNPPNRRSRRTVPRVPSRFPLFSRNN
jgi:hypothetical protein